MKIQNLFKYLIYLILVYLLAVLKGYFGSFLSNSYLRMESSPMLFYAIIYILLGVSIGF